ncbi:dNA polymerase III subunit beta [Prevotella sp. CAG:1058]|jgi:DNA polymerase-3 subunit beta|nr:dNA polymerase III subunit beta [Prevotella sp. CAG:1058]
MRLTISSTTLASRLTALSKVFNSKNSLPILDCYLFEVNSNQLTITASDSENVMTTQIQLDESDGNGTFAVNNRNILDAVKELPEQPLTLDVDMSTYAIKVIYMNGMYNFTAQSGDEFPRMQPLNDSAAAITIESKTLANDIAHSIFATANEELRPVMNGIYFDLKEDSLAIVASDGHKLVRTLNKNIKSEKPMSFILPKKPATLLKNVLQKTEDDVIIRFDDRNANILFPEGTLACRLIEGRYPNYNSVIPQDNPNLLTVDRMVLASVVRRVLPFASDSSQQIRLHIETGKAVISSEDIDFYTSAKEEIVCDYNGMPMDIGFKGTSLMEILTNLDGEEVELKLADPSRPCLIIPTNQPENEDVLMLIMPMLLND